MGGFKLKQFLIRKIKKKKKKIVWYITGLCSCTSHKSVGDDTQNKQQIGRQHQSIIKWLNLIPLPNMKKKKLTHIGRQSGAHIIMKAMSNHKCSCYCNIATDFNLLRFSGRKNKIVNLNSYFHFIYHSFTFTYLRFILVLHGLKKPPT